jgi:hypothetical protein
LVARNRRKEGGSDGGKGASGGGESPISVMVGAITCPMGPVVLRLTRGLSVRVGGI